MSIEAQAATIYLAPTAGRRFLTKKAAINKEARAIIKKYHPDELGCPGLACDCGDPGWSLERDQPERFARYYRLLTRALSRSIK